MMTRLIPARSVCDSVRSSYIDLLKRAVINHLYQDRTRSWIARDMDSAYVESERHEGRDHPHQAHTMIGWQRLTNIEECVAAIVQDEIPGDLLEAGVWRGGAVIFMKGLLEAFRDETRRVWVADSFEGVPPPTLDADAWSKLHTREYLSVSRQQVEENFARYGLLDDRVVFLEGLFQKTFPATCFPPLSLIRLDGDLYESTRVALESLYPCLSTGGFVIIDDYLEFEACRAATDEYRTSHEIHEPVVQVDSSAVFWKKTA